MEQIGNSAPESKLFIPDGGKAFQQRGHLGAVARSKTIRAKRASAMQCETCTQWFPANAIGMHSKACTGKNRIRNTKYALRYIPCECGHPKPIAYSTCWRCCSRDERMRELDALCGFTTEAWRLGGRDENGEPKERPVWAGKVIETNKEPAVTQTSLSTLVARVMHI